MLLTLEGVHAASRWSELLPTSLQHRVRLREVEVEETFDAGSPPSNPHSSAHQDLSVESSPEPLFVLEVNGVSFPLAPSHWGFASVEGRTDRQAVLHALETVIQGHAPDYWRETQDPLVRALGWLDRRVGKRSWRQADEHGLELSSLDQQFRAAREQADWDAAHPLEEEPLPAAVEPARPARSRMMA